MNNELFLKEISNYKLKSEENQIKYIINKVMKGVIDQIEQDFGTNSFFGYHDESKGEDGIYIIDKGLCSIKLSDESKSTLYLNKYDFFGPVGYLKELIKKTFLLKHSSLNVVAESDEVK